MNFVENVSFTPRTPDPKLTVIAYDRVLDILFVGPRQGGERDGGMGGGGGGSGGKWGEGGVDREEK